MLLNRIFVKIIRTEFTIVFITLFKITSTKFFPAAVSKRISHPCKNTNETRENFPTFKFSNRSEDVIYYL